MMLRCIGPALLVVCSVARAQRPDLARSDWPVKPDSASLALALAGFADAVSQVEALEGQPLFTIGVASGGLTYEGGRSETAVATIVRIHPLAWLSIGVNPTLARASEPTGLRRAPTLIANGLTDIPIDAAIERDFDAPLAPGLGVDLSTTAPVGNTATGFGTGSATLAGSVSASLTPVDRLGVHLSAGRSLTDFSVQSSFNGTAAEWGDLAVAAQVTERVSASLDYNGDMGGADPVNGRAGTLSGGFTATFLGTSQLSGSVSRGISGIVPRWSFSLGFGTELASVGSIAYKAPVERLRRTFGAGRHGLATTKKTVSSGRRRIGRYRWPRPSGSPNTLHE